MDGSVGQQVPGSKTSVCNVVWLGWLGSGPVGMALGAGAEHERRYMIGGVAPCASGWRAAGAWELFTADGWAEHKKGSVGVGVWVELELGWSGWVV